MTLKTWKKWDRAMPKYHKHIIFKCPSCGKEDNLKNFIIAHQSSKYKMCPSCGHLWQRGDLIITGVQNTLNHNLYKNDIKDNT